MYTAIITKDGDWWLGWVEEIPGANAQERTKAELLISLKEATKDIIELRWQEVRSEMNLLCLPEAAGSPGQVRYEAGAS